MDERDLLTGPLLTSLSDCTRPFDLKRGWKDSIPHLACGLDLLAVLHSASGKSLMCCRHNAEHKIESLSYSRLFTPKYHLWWDAQRVVHRIDCKLDRFVDLNLEEIELHQYRPLFWWAEGISTAKMKESALLYQNLVTIITDESHAEETGTGKGENLVHVIFLFTDLRNGISRILTSSMFSWLYQFKNLR